MASKVSVKSKDKGWGAFWQRAEDLVKLRSARVRVGVLGDTQKGREARGKITMAELAAVLHFGTKDGHIPPRPFLTQTFDEKRSELKALGAQLMAEVIFGHITLEQALNAMGSKLAADVKNTITAGMSPPNAPSTAFGKAMKGKTKSYFVAKYRKNTVGKGKNGKVKLAGLGDAFAAIGATAAAEQGGYGLPARIRRTGVKAARGLGDAFAQIGAIASVKPLIDTGRLLGAITWSVDLNGDKK